MVHSLIIYLTHLLFLNVAKEDYYYEHKASTRCEYDKMIRKYRTLSQAQYNCNMLSTCTMVTDYKCFVGAWYDHDCFWICSGTGTQWKGTFLEEPTESWIRKGKSCFLDKPKS